jgi:hypothetical protein
MLTLCLCLGLAIAPNGQISLGTSVYAMDDDADWGDDNLGLDNDYWVNAQGENGCEMSKTLEVLSSPSTSSNDTVNELMAAVKEAEDVIFTLLTTRESTWTIIDAEESAYNQSLNAAYFAFLGIEPREIISIQDMMDYLCAVAQIVEQGHLTTSDTITYLRETLAIQKKFIETGITYDNLLKNEGEATSPCNLIDDIPEKRVCEYNLTQAEVSLKNMWILGFRQVEKFEINDDYRVRLMLRNVNFVVGSTSGLSLSLQKRKKALWGLIKYWVNVDAENRVLGFNTFETTLTLKTPMPAFTPDPGGMSNQRLIAGSVLDKTMQYFCKEAMENDIYKDISNKVQEWIMYAPFVTATTAEQMYKAGIEQGLKAIRKQGKSLIIDHILKLEKDPLQSLRPPYWDGKTMKHGITGEKTLGSGGDVDVMFHLSFGFAVGYGGGSVSAKPNDPESFKIDKADIYGAVKHNNQWYGIRMVGK